MAKSSGGPSFPITLAVASLPLSSSLSFVTTNRRTADFCLPFHSERVPSRSIFHPAIVDPKVRIKGGTIRNMVLAPPGSGYASEEDEISSFPEEYEPTMEYPGTMRPGRTRENISFQDLPIGDDEPNPVPWPHFQEIDFYHVWPAPHPHAELVNDMIEREGRWATPEEEAEMMRDARRGVRMLKEMAEAEKKSFVVVDDDEEEQDIESADDELADDDDDISGDDDEEEATVMRRMRDILAAETSSSAASEGVASRKTPKEEAHEVDMDEIDFSLDDNEEDDSTSMDDEDDDDDMDEDFLMNLGLDDEEDDSEEEGRVSNLAHKVGSGAVDESSEMDEEDDAGIDLEDLDVDDYDHEGGDDYFSADDFGLDEDEAYDDDEGNY